MTRPDRLLARGRNVRRALSGGFTLIEIMITVAIVGILTVIALPNYAEYVRRANRADARLTLMQAANFLERTRTERGSYQPGGTPPALPAALATSPSGSGAVPLYDIAIVATTGTTYQVRATPRAGRAMASDPCGAFTLDNTGLRGVTGARAASECWVR